MKATLPQGTRDFSPEVLVKRNFIINTIKTVFELYGFQPLETPAMENLTTLTGKYGEEGDRLIFKILNNGLYEKKEADKEKLNQEFQKLLEKPYNTPVVTERALRYDLTIPFARFVANNANNLSFPFKRYQIQPVWRADRPQKGRYREFYQCDADVVGSNSLIYEGELLAIYSKVFFLLNIPDVSIKINNRKILSALAIYAGLENQMNDITIAIDKLDKIGIEGVKNELSQKNITGEQINKIENFLNISGTNEEKLNTIKSIFSAIEIAQFGIKELETTLNYASMLTNNGRIEIDFTLARGLDYYTGFIAEVKTTAVKMGSIGGGGRYDNLTGMFDLPNVSGVGVSFGLDRIYDVMEELNLFPNEIASSSKVLFMNYGEQSEFYALPAMNQLRLSGISCEIYPENVKMEKQLKYAQKRNFKFLCFVGEEEIKNKTFTLKNFETREQETLRLEQLISKLK